MIRRKAHEVVVGDTHAGYGRIVDIKEGTVGPHTQYTFKHLDGGVSRYLSNEPVTLEEHNPDGPTALDRIMAGGRTQPLTPVEVAFFGRPDHMVKPHGGDRVALGEEPDIRVSPPVRERLRKVLMHDARFNGTYGNGIGYSEFIARALDALDCEG